jgi:Zn-dependent peptidase ImmA (M78 family)
LNRAMAEFQHGNLSTTIRDERDLELMVRRLQNQLYIHSDKIWKENFPEVSIEVLKPDIVFKKVLGYVYVEAEGLGTHEVNGDRFEVAGIIDKSKRVVQVSRRFPEESKRFTAAHELGHAILHNQTILHRDRAIDGSGNTIRLPEELQADKFAAFFLMPGKAVRKVFEDVFKTSRFEINEGNVLGLRVGDIRSFRDRCGNLRGLGRELAAAEFFGGENFNSLAKVFGVSIGTMAIRLEELGLVSF